MTKREELLVQNDNIKGMTIQEGKKFPHKVFRHLMLVCPENNVLHLTTSKEDNLNEERHNYYFRRK